MRNERVKSLHTELTCAPSGFKRTLKNRCALNNTQLVLLNTLCVLRQHTLCAKLDDHYILAHLNVFVNTQGVLNSTVRNGSVFCNTPFI